MSNIYDELKQKIIKYLDYDPTVFDSTRSVLEQLEIVKDWLANYPSGFVIWRAPGYVAPVSAIMVSALSSFLGEQEEGVEPKVKDLVLLTKGQVYEILTIEQGYATLGQIADLQGSVGPVGNTGLGVDDLSAITFPYGVPAITFDTTEGVHIFGGARLTVDDTTVEPAAEITVPIVPGTGIVMDANENNDAVEVSIDPNITSDLEMSLKLPVDDPTEPMIPVVQPGRNQTYEPLSSLGGGGEFLYMCQAMFDYAGPQFKFWIPVFTGVSKITALVINYADNSQGVNLSYQYGVNQVIYNNGNKSDISYVPFGGGSVRWDYTEDFMYTNIGGAPSDAGKYPQLILKITM